MKNIIKIKCIDRVGLIADISHEIKSKNINLISFNEFVDKETNTFFMRCILDVKGNSDFDTSILEESLKEILPENAKVQISNKSKKKVFILVTKESHCLGDLLIREFSESLNMEILGVIGNHETLGELVRKFNKPFHFVGHEGVTKEKHETQIERILNSQTFDYIVLAKYMRILSKDFVQKFENQMINIHHSFLPSFKGANPYLQAYERGVKVIGATAHFVTDDLDEGPIITQEVIPVDHSLNAKELRSSGQNIETLTLARALNSVFAEKVFINGNKTVVF